MIASQHCFILAKGSIENYYPIDLIIKALKAEFKIEITDEEKNWLVNSDNRMRSIKRILKRKRVDLDGRSPKIEIGKSVAERMGKNLIPKEISKLFEKIKAL